MREDRCLVVAGRAREDAIFAVDAADGGFEGRNCPLGRRNGLAVVMRVEDDGVLRALRQDLAGDDGRRTGQCEQTGIDSAASQRIEQKIGVPLEIRRVSRDVGDGEELAELTG